MAHLKLFTDGACRGNPGEAAVGLVLKDETGKVLENRHRYLGHTTNNVAEYVGLIRGLKLAAEFTPSELDVYMDSKLVVEQVNERWKVKDTNLRELWSEARKLMNSLPQVRVQYIPRERNIEADLLANQALDEEQGRKRRLES
jgi:probable phosphoglycerate mutase